MVAIDHDAAALAALEAVAGVSCVVADLEKAPWPLAESERFAAVIVTNYLHRPLLPRLLVALAEGGILIVETFARGNASVGRPANPAFLLDPGELLEWVRGTLRVVAYQDGFLASPRPAYRQRICAVRETAGNGSMPPRYELAG